MSDGLRKLTIYLSILGYFYYFGAILACSIVMEVLHILPLPILLLKKAFNACNKSHARNLLSIRTF